MKNNKYRIYHDTLFEAADKFDLRLNDNQVHFLLINYFDNGDIIGLLPSVAFAKLYKQNEKLNVEISYRMSDGKANTENIITSAGWHKVILPF